MRESIYDKFKPLSQQRREAGKKCSHCDEPLTLFQGPGSDTLCRDHQLIMIEYGGVGRLDRPHSFHRNANFICDDCGWSILDDHRLAGIEDEDKKRQVARILLHGDHLIRQADGGDDSKENVKSLCVVCHAKKTVLNNDNRPGIIKGERRLTHGLHDTTD